MPNLTPTDIAIPDRATRYELVQFGTTVSRMQVIRLATVNDETRYLLSDATTLENSLVSGIALSGGVADEWGIMISMNNVILKGAGMNIQQSQVLSATPGAITQHADLVTGNFVTYIGQPLSAEQLSLGIDVTGVAVP